MTDHGWTITIEAAGDEGIGITDAAVSRFHDELQLYAGAVGGGQEHNRYGATLSIREAGDIGDAIAYGTRVFENAARAAGLPALAIVHLEAMTFDEHDADLARPAVPELVGVTEISKILAVSRQRAHQITKRDDFPAPLAELAAGPVWARPHLDRFVETWHAGKPDVIDELVELDQVLDDLTRLRNDVAHGRADAPENIYAWLLTAGVAHKRYAHVTEEVQALMRERIEQITEDLRRVHTEVDEPAGSAA